MLIKITDIVPSPFQKRTHFDVESLTADILSHGLLQPIIVRPIGGKDRDIYELIAGERRLRAYKVLAEKFVEFGEIEAIVKEKCDDDAAQAIHLSENLQREGITPLEEAAELSQLLEHCTLKQAAEYLGRSAGWIAQRANLSKLCPKFRTAYGKDEKIKMWPIESLELVARMPNKIQEEILEQHRWTIPTVKELKKEMNLRIMKLASTTWAKDSDDCAKCQKRTAAAPDLFSEINVTKDDRCLDSKCFAEHVEKMLAQKIKEATADGEKIHTIIDGHSDCDPLQYNNPIKRDALNYGFKKVKQGTKGAVPALVVGGSGIGDTVFIKIDESTPGMTAKPKGPKTMKEKRAALEKRRVIRYLGKVVETIETIVKKRHEFPYAATVPLVSIFGAERLPDGKNMTWKSPLDCKFNDDHGQAELFACIAPKIIKELQQEMQSMTPEKKHGDIFREWLGIHTEKLYDEAVAEIPEPKSWASETKPAKSETKMGKKGVKNEN